MTEAEKFARGAEFLEWFGIYTVSTLIAFFIIRAIIKRKKKGSLNLKRVTTTGPKVFAFLIGAALLLVSCFLNAMFGMMLAKAMPEYPVVGMVTAVLLGLGNLASIFAIKEAVERRAAGDKRGYWIARGKWLVITCFSLMTASSIFLSLNGQLEHMGAVADAKVSLNNEKIEANKNIIKNSGLIPSADTAKFQNLFIKNSNGARVRLTSVCTKNSGWYYNNYQSCRDYRTALSNSGQITRNAQLEQENIALGAASIAELEGKPPVFKPTFFGVPVDTKWAFFFVAVFMEIAAEVCLSYAFAKIPNRPAAKSGIKDAGIDGGNPKKSIPDPKGLDAPASEGAAPAKKKPNPETKVNKTPPAVKDAPRPPLKRGMPATMKALPNPHNNSVLEDEIDDLLYQLAVENPQTKVTGDEINDLIKAHRNGKGVKLDRILKAFRRNTDVVLVDNSKGRPQFILRDVTSGTGSAKPATATAEPAVSTLSSLPRA